MNLQPLFEMQDVLDKKIVKEKGLEGQDLVQEKILALQVELGELANEWRGFKFWSENQKPRTEQYCLTCGGRGDYQWYIEAPMIEVAMVECTDCDGTGVEKNPLLEEFVDCLHFILSIGNSVNMKVRRPRKLVSFFENVTGDFNSVFRIIAEWNKFNLLLDEDLFYLGLNNFLALGDSLGFTWEQIEQAYMDKNKVNHERQQNGY